MVPVALAMLFRMRWKLDRDWKGVSFGVLTGFMTGLGILGYYAALKAENVSVVTPVTGLYPLLTVVLAVIFLRERLNRVQIGGVVLALAAIPYSHSEACDALGALRCHRHLSVGSVRHHDEAGHQPHLGAVDGDLGYGRVSGHGSRHVEVFRTL